MAVLGNITTYRIMTSEIIFVIVIVFIVMSEQMQFGSHNIFSPKVCF